ncbi:unnamed protein product [Meganyctiphanes norvegica]|uniref:Uncharacterized protein n=1 Tax=Meganyctiphanes norvegica TaxID=48144 RepID=A0AAV2RE58_MEGNR
MVPIRSDIHDFLCRSCNPKCPIGSVSTALAKMFVSGDLDTLNKCLVSGVDPNLSLPGGYTPLTTVIKNAEPERWVIATKILLEAGASPNVKDPSCGRTVLSLLAESGKSELVLLALKNGANYTTSDPDGETPLSIAVYYRHLECINFLLQYGADPNTICSDGNSVLMQAVGRAHSVGIHRTLSCVKALLHNGARTDFVGRGGTTLLMAAGKRSDYVKELLKAGANPDSTDDQGETALMKAVDYDAVDVVQALVRGGANVNIQSNFGFVAAMTASSEEVMVLLLENDADLDMIDYDGNTILHHQTGRDRSVLCNLLLNYGAKIDAINFMGDTPLQLSVRSRNYITSNLLLDRGSKPSSVNKRCISILQNAIVPWDYFNTHNLFTEFNTSDSASQYLFHTTECGGRVTEKTLSLVKRLLVQGADVNHSGEAGVSALMLATATGDATLIQSLLNAGVHVNATDEEGRTALAYSCRWGYENAARMLLSSGSLVNTVDKHNNIPVFYAAHHCHTDILILLSVELAFYFKECQAQHSMYLDYIKSSKER